jgi:hypothetical protein
MYTFVTIIIIVHKVIGFKFLLKHLINIKLALQLVGFLLMIAAFFYSLNKIESIQDLEQVDQDNKIELVKLKEKAANETNQIIQSLEEGIIVIQNNTVLFKNRIFDKI